MYHGEEAAKIYELLDEFLQEMCQMRNDQLGESWEIRRESDEDETDRVSRRR